VKSEKFFFARMRKSDGQIQGADRYLSNGTVRLGSLAESVIAATGRFADSASSPTSCRAAICFFTLSINTTNFFASWSLSACLHIFWKSCGA
jgi:hypothetical protein